MQWKKQQPSLTPGRLFFLDETSVKTNMVREYGWAPRGERLVASVPHGHRKTSTFIGCLHQGGLVAPYVLDGAVNGKLFVAYIEQQVVPNLARGDVLVMDNLPVHKAAGVRKALEAAGIALLFLPAYSPDLNPIEGAFRDAKDLRFGMGMGAMHVSTPDRRDRLWLINAFAVVLLTLLGAAGEALGYDRHLKSNTSARRTHSLFRQGSMLYELIPTMPEHRLQPLVEQFARMLAAQPVFREMFGAV